MSNVASWVGGLALNLAAISGRAPRWLVLFLLVVLGGGILSSCGGGGDGGGGNNCTVTGVTVSASPTSVAANAMSTVTATVNASSACSGAVTWNASPAGGTLTVNGGSATFASGTAGTYTITAKSNDDPSKTGSATVAVTNVCAVAGVAATANPTSIAANGTSTVTATVNASGACSQAVTWDVSPAGGTLTVNGGTATFTSGTAGTYTITAKSNDDPSKTGSATVIVTAAVACGTPNGTVVTHSANISADETWAGDGVTHQVLSNIAINGAATVTVQPCAIVAMGPGATITVNNTAKLLSAGTSATSFVVFQRANVNQPWGILRGASATSMIELHWTVLQGAGAFGGQYNNPAIAAVGPGYFVPPAAVLKVDNVFIQSPQGTGVYFDTNAAFTADSQALTISGATTFPLMANMMALGSIPSGTYTGNATDEIMVVGPNANVFGDLTIHDRGVPVRIQTTGFTVAPTGGATAPVTLTVEPGVVIKFPKANPNAPGARVIFGTNGNAPNNVVGVLHAVGTPAKPIVFTSGEAVPAPGDWVGLFLDTATGSKLDYVEISYAGGDSLISSANCRPASTRDNAALIIGDFDTQYVPPADLITNSLISHSAGFGIDAVWRAPAYNAPDLTASNTFQSNAMCAQTFNSPTQGTCPALGCTAN